MSPAVPRTQVPPLTRRAHDPVRDIEPLPGAQRRIHRFAHALALVRVHALQEVVQAIGGRPEAVDGAGRVRQGKRLVAQVYSQKPNWLTDSPMFGGSFERWSGGMARRYERIPS